MELPHKDVKITNISRCNLFKDLEWGEEYNKKWDITNGTSRDKN